MAAVVLSGQKLSDQQELSRLFTGHLARSAGRARMVSNTRGSGHKVMETSRVRLVRVRRFFKPHESGRGTQTRSYPRERIRPVIILISLNYRLYFVVFLLQTYLVEEVNGVLFIGFS